MSLGLNARQQKERDDAAATNQLLMEVAFATAVDPALAALVALRPHCVAAIVHQARYVAQLVAAMKASCFQSLAAEAAMAATQAGRHATTGGGAHAIANAAAPTGAVATPLQVHITVVGCGAVGGRIVDELRSCGRFHPTSLRIVSRQPEVLGRFAACGIPCHRNAADAVPESDLVIVACQPGQFPAAARAMKPHLRPSCVVLSVCCGISAEKVCAELGHAACLTTSVDTDALSRRVAAWTREDDAVARYHRAAYAASKLFAEAAAALTEDERRLVTQPPEERRAARGRAMAAQAFPAAPIEFLNCLLFALAGSVAHRRGAAAGDAVAAAWRLVAGPRQPLDPALRPLPIEREGGTGAGGNAATPVATATTTALTVSLAGHGHGKGSTGTAAAPTAGAERVPFFGAGSAARKLAAMSTVSHWAASANALLAAEAADGGSGGGGGDAGSRVPGGSGPVTVQSIVALAQAAFDDMLRPIAGGGRSVVADLVDGHSV